MSQSDQIKTRNIPDAKWMYRHYNECLKIIIVEKKSCHLNGNFTIYVLLSHQLTCRKSFSMKMPNFFLMKVIFIKTLLSMLQQWMAMHWSWRFVLLNYIFHLVGQWLSKSFSRTEFSKFVTFWLEPQDFIKSHWLFVLWVILWLPGNTGSPDKGSRINQMCRWLPWPFQNMKLILATARVNSKFLAALTSSFQIFTDLVSLKEK